MIPSGRHPSRFLSPRVVSVFSICLLILLFVAFDIGCPIKRLTGISCAGCGMTRAWLSVIRLDLEGALTFHPLFWAVPLAGVLFLLPSKYSLLVRITVAILVVLMLVVYGIRMLDPSDTVVVFSPREGQLYRWGSALISWLRDRFIT